MKTDNNSDIEISIILPVYNNEQYIPLVLESILEQTYSLAKVEVIAVDDNSGDKSLLYLQRYKNKYPSLIKIIDHKVNKGRACTRNSGIKKAQGDVILFLDSDISLDKNYLERAMDFLHNSDAIGVVGKILPGEKLKRENYNKYQKYLYEAPRGAMQEEDVQPVSYPHFLFSLAAVEKKAVDSVGLMDEKLTHHGGEDTEYAFRMEKQFKGQLYFNPKLKGYHQDYITFSRALKRMEEYGRYNVPYIVDKHPQMKEIYFYQYLEGSNIMKRYIGRIVQHNLFYKVMYNLYKVVPPPLVFGVIKILFGTALLRGIKKNTKLEPG